MYWPGASVLGQYWATAFICELPAAHTGERVDPASVKTTQCFSHQDLKEQQDFPPDNVDCSCEVRKPPARMWVVVKSTLVHARPPCLVLVLQVPLGTDIHFIVCQNCQSRQDSKVYLRLAFLLSGGRLCACHRSLSRAFAHDPLYSVFFSSFLTYCFQCLLIYLLSCGLICIYIY